MPYRKRIAEVDAAIEKLRAAIAGLRGTEGNRSPKVDKLLGELAKLRARRTRYMMRQRLFLSEHQPPLGRRENSS